MTLDLKDAHALHAQAPVLDLHADTPKLMHKIGFDLAARHGRPGRGPLNLVGHVDLPRLREGGVAGQFFGLWTVPYPERGCTASTHKQLDAVDAAIARTPGEIVWALTPDDIMTAKQNGQVAALAGIEGAQALESDPGTIQRFAERGVRYLGLLHFSANALGAPARGRGEDPDRGLSALGHEVIAELERCGVIVDLAHINRKGFFDALAIAKHPLMVTHTGVAGVHEHWRNIDDEQIRAVADNGGCIGIIFARRFLGGRSIEAVCDHLMHIVAVAGEGVPALGSDFDGFVAPPEGLEDVSCLPNLTVALSKRGASVRLIEKILGGNVMRVLGAVPPTAWQRAHAV